MYLYRRQHAYAGRKDALRVMVDGTPLSFVPDYTTCLREEIGYWRKANQIHHWFVENVQEGGDDCGEYVVSRDQLKSLLTLVDEAIKSIKLVPGVMSVGQGPDGGEGFDGERRGFVVENPAVAEKLLPPRKGFFFGSYGYDSWYFEGLVVTKDILERALRSDKDVTFSYQSSW